MSRNVIIGIVVAIVVVVGGVIGIIAATSGGDDDGGSAETETTATTETSGTATSGTATSGGSSRFFEGITQTGVVLGEPDAPVKIVEFADIQCPFCAQASKDVVPTIVDDYVKPGTASLEFVAIAFIGPDSERGAIAVEAAAEQDAAWDMAEALYAKQGGENDGWLSDDTITATAEELGLDMDAFQSAYQGDDAAQAILDNQDRAGSEGVSSTPTYLVEGPEGQEVVAGADLAALEDAIATVQGSN